MSYGYGSSSDVPSCAAFFALFAIVAACAVLAFGGLYLVLQAGFGSPEALAQGPAWPDRGRVVQYIHNNPEQVADILERNLSQQRLDALWNKMFPPASNAQRLNALRRAKKRLLRADYTESDAVVQTITAEIEALAPLAEEE